MNKNQKKKYFYTLVTHVFYLVVFLVLMIIRKSENIGAVSTFHIGSLAVTIVVDLIVFGGLIRNTTSLDEKTEQFLSYVSLSSLCSFLSLLNWIGNGVVFALSLRRAIQIVFYLMQFVLIFRFLQILRILVCQTNAITNDYYLIKTFPGLKAVNLAYVFLTVFLIGAIFTNHVFTIDNCGIFHKRMFDFLPAASMLALSYIFVFACRNKPFADVLRVTITIYALVNTAATSWQIVSPYYDATMALNGCIIMVVYCTNYLEMEIYNSALNQKFERYVSEDEARKILLEDKNALTLGGKKSDVSVMMCQLRDFELISKLLDSQDVGRLLNHYYEEMDRIIESHRGTVLSFPGYGIMAVFGAPIMYDNFTTEAVNAAIEMQQAMNAVNKWNHENHLPMILMGTAIANGDTILGNIGSEKHMRYSAISRIVNLCSRIETYAKPGEILITEKTRLLYNGSLKTKEENHVYMKGFTDSIMFYQIELGGDDE